MLERRDLDRLQEISEWEPWGDFSSSAQSAAAPRGTTFARPRAALPTSPDPFQPWDFGGAALAPQSRGGSRGRGRGKPERRGGAVARGGAAGPGIPAAGDRDQRFALRLRLLRRLLLAPPGCRFPPSAQGQATREGAGARAASRLPPFPAHRWTRASPRARTPASPAVRPALRAETPGGERL